MGCKIHVALLSERVDSDIGDDWQYAVEARVVDQTGSRSGRIEVELHKLTSGVTQDISDVHATDIEAGPCGSAVELELHLRAAEFDWIMSDIGEHKTRVRVECPGPGAPPAVIEREVAVRVKEQPLVLGGVATLILKVRITAVCD